MARLARAPVLDPLRTSRVQCNRLANAERLAYPLTNCREIGIMQSYAVRREEIMLHRKRAALILAASLLLISASGRVSADAIPGAFVVVGELEIDPPQLEAYKAAIKVNQETAVRVEPGCLGANAVFEKENPTRVRLFEIYTNADAFRAH